MRAYADYASPGMVAADAPANVRAEFIQKTYLHLGFAILGFTALTALIINSPLAEPMMRLMLGTPYSWLIVLVAFMGVGFIAERWAQSATSMAMQYAGLALYVAAQAFIFVPILYIAAFYSHPSVIPTAGILTGTVFGGLTAVAFLTKRDFSFMGRALSMAGFAAIGLIVCSILFGFTLGTIFSFALIVLASGYILYYTSNIIHHYPIGSHVAAALALFAAVALLFWYMLRLVMAFTSRD